MSDPPRPSASDPPRAEPRRNPTSRGARRTPRVPTPRALLEPSARASLLWLGAIMVVAAALRLYRLDLSPPGLNQDEALSAWNSWCLWKTGRDMTGQAWPVFYGHGLLGTGNEVTAGNLRTLANTYGFVLAATDWQGFSNPDIGTIFGFIGELSGFRKLPERSLQGVLNQLVLARLMKSPTGFMSDPAFIYGGTPIIDGSDVFYYGISQGGIMGGIGGFSGAVPTLWCTLRGMEKDRQRSVIQNFNLTTLAFTQAAYVLTGMVTKEMLPVFAIVAPAMLVPAWLGTRLYLGISAATFRKIVLTALTGAGIAMLASALPALFSAR